MCLGIPMKLIEIKGHTARCEAKGVEREVSLFMLQEEALAVGDYVMVHVGYALQKLSLQEVRSTWELLDQIIGNDEILAWTLRRGQHHVPDERQGLARPHP